MYISSNISASTGTQCPVLLDHAVRRDLINNAQYVFR